MWVRFPLPSSESSLAPFVVTALKLAARRSGLDGFGIHEQLSREPGTMALVCIKRALPTQVPPREPVELN